MGRASAAIRRTLPDTPLARQLAGRSLLYATGFGTFSTGSAFYFIHFVRLSAAQVGLAMSIAGVAAFATAVPLGRLADRLGHQRVWFVCSLLETVSYLFWPLAHNFLACVAILLVGQVIDSAGSAARGAYTLDVFPPEERVRSLAFQRSALNIGFTLGALLGGIALALPTDAGIRALPFVTAAILGVGGVLILRLPPERVDDESAAPELPAAGNALRNRGFLILNVFDGVLTTNQTLLNVVIPLWLVQETDAPRVLLAWLFGTNTVLAVLLQVPASRGSDTIPGAIRASRISAAFFTLSCLIVLVTHSTIGWVTIVLIWVGHVTVTGAELFDSAANWGFTSQLSDPRRRGEYQGVARVGFNVGSLWAPALYTFLAMQLHAVGWLIIAAIVLAATTGIPASARAAQRFLQTHAPPTEPVISRTSPDPA